MEVTGKTSLLSRELRGVLTQVDGKATVGDIHQKLDKFSEGKLFDTLGKLSKDGFVREFVSAPTSISPPSQVPIVQEEGEDLDFTDLASSPPSRPTPPARAEEAARQNAEADEVARQVASARAKDEAEAKAKAKREAEAEEKSRRAAAEKAKREEEGKAKREGERAKRDAEERARREAKERERRELDEKAQREVEEKARRAAEERAKREEEEKARRAFEERERRAAEERTRKEREAEERIRRELEDRIKAAEDQARREAESRRRREEEERARREAEEREQREAAEQARREAEERERREAEERARREAEERAKREAEEQARREAEEKVQRELEERERREAEEKDRAEAARRAREEEKARAKAEAEAAARARREERAREKAEADERAEARAKEAAKERAEVAARLDAIKSGRTGGRVGRYLGGTLIAILVIGLIAAQFIPLDTAFYGKIASRALGQPVKIGAGEFSLLPLPTVTLRDVVIGADGAVRIASIKGSPDIDSLMGETRVFSSVELSGVTAQPMALRALLWGKVRGQDLVVKRANASGVKLTVPGVPLPELSFEAVLGRDGEVKLLTASTAGDRLSVRVEPDGNRATVEITAKELQGVLGLKLPIEDFGGKGVATAGGLEFTQFDGKLLDGFVKGKGSLRWDAGWAFEGDVEVRQIDATRIVPSVLGSGRLEGEGKVVASAPTGDKLFDAPRTEASFNIGKGQLSNLDLVRMIQTGSSTAGSTTFSEITGRISSNPERIQLRDLRLGAGPLSANGSVELTASDKISGRITAQMDTPAGVRRGNITLTGSVSKLQAGR